MLRSYQEQGKQKGWFGSRQEKPNKDDEDKEKSRKFGSHSVVLPTTPKQIIDAHQGESACVRYDDSGADLVATCGNDSLVKVWDTQNGSLRATMRGTSGHIIASCDIAGGLVAGGGSDKQCRVWNLQTERMIHQLVGHANKITAVRLFGDQKLVLTASADRSLKIWDIARKTYRQTTTFRHGSTAYCVDVASDSQSAVSGHMDGGLRFWDVRSGDRTGNIGHLHKDSITSVNINPAMSTQVLTQGKDSCLKIVDVRTGNVVHTLRHEEFRTGYNWSSSSFSPDGMLCMSAYFFVLFCSCKDSFSGLVTCPIRRCLRGCNFRNGWPVVRVERIGWKL